MILADKIIDLRKKSGMSQEDLAFKLNVSRQSVSKWESMQSIPDIDKIIAMAKLFNVTTDYLLKDDVNEIELSNEYDEPSDSKVIKLTVEEATKYMNLKKETAPKFALGVLLCVISPVLLIFLSCLSEYDYLSDTLACIIGMTFLLVFVMIAVFLFIYGCRKLSDFEYMDNKVFETEYGVSSIIKEKREQFQEIYTKGLIIGIALIFTGLLFLICMAFTNNIFAIIGSVCLFLVLTGLACYVFVINGNVMESFTKLLQEGEYTKINKTSVARKLVSRVYWPLITVIFLVVSFSLNCWDRSWIIMAVAGVLYPVIVAIVNCITENKEK